GLYAITPEHSSDARLLADAAAVLAGGAVMLQYRSKRDSASRRHARAVALLALCRAHDALFIVNDDVALADAIGADGVHLGASDTGVAQARARLGRRAIIGASCYADLQRARRACAAGASYVAFGAFFPSPTKPQAAPAAADLLRESAALGVPRVAIGGIQLENAPLLVDAGADLLAVVSDVFG